MPQSQEELKKELNKESNKFGKLAASWWDADGVLAPLHRINVQRSAWIRQQCAQHWGEALLAEQQVLDLGCGGGLLSEELARWGMRVTAVDIEASLIEVAKQHAQLQQLNIDYRHADAEALLKQNERFDLICCMDVLEHVADPSKMVTEIAQLLKPQGIAIFATINRSVFAWLAIIWVAQSLCRFLPKDTHHFKRFIKPCELIAFGEAAGLKCLTHTGLRYNPLRQKASLSAFMGINYLLLMQKS